MPINITKGTNLNEKEKRLIMGMAASQVNFLALTARKSDISLELQRLSGTKESLSRDMQKVTREYRDALNTKTLKWSGNSGVTYTDLSYSTLMQPGSTTDNSPLLITNLNGNVVLSEQYAKYAKMLDGKKYEGETRYEILSSLTNVSVDTLKKADTTSKEVEDAKTAMDEAKKHRDTEIPYKNMTYDKITSKFLTSVSKNKSEKLTLESAKNVITELQKALCGHNYFTSDVEGKFIKSCSNFLADYENNQNKEDDKNEYKNTTVGEWINILLTSLEQKVTGNDVTTGSILLRIDNNDNGTQADYDAADAAYKAAQQAYKDAVGNNSEVINAPTTRKIEFYDKLFQAISDMGWEEDDSVSDSDYLNQMFQNNCFYITTMTKNTNYDSTKEIDNRNYKYYYDTEAAENDPNIFKVNDSSVHEEALAKYEYEKSEINEKETRIDTRMKNLETEQSAITKMLESIDKVKNDNIERTMNLWS